MMKTGIHRRNYMAYQIEWLLENRVLYIKAVGDVTIEDLEAAISIMTTMLDNGEAPIHSISDNRFVGKFPTSLSTLRKLMTPHPKAKGWSLLIQNNTATRFIGEMLTRFSGQSKIKSFTTLVEGLAFLERNDPSLGTIRNPE
jgi:hypothetical protein